jgi:carbon-monoxide dehydrogenase medium subunit
MEYYQPDTLHDALSLLSKYDGQARVIAGGTDVLVDMKFREPPACLINIKRVPGLAYIEPDGDGVRIGPLTTIRALEMSAVIRERFPVLWDSVHQFASVQIRNTATIGGNIGRASPSGETLAPLVILGASVTVLLPAGERELLLDGFFLGPGRTVLGSTGLLKEIRIPYPAQGASGAYLKHAVRGAMDIAIAGVAIQMTPEESGRTVRDLRIGLTAVAPVPMRAGKAEAIVTGKPLSAGLIDEAARAAAAESQPITDHRASAEYRRWIVEALTRRGIRMVWERITGQGIEA